MPQGIDARNLPQEEDRPDGRFSLVSWGRVVDILEKAYSWKENNFSMEKLNTHGARADGFGCAGSKDTKDLGCAFAPDRCMPIHRASDRRCVRSFHYFLLALVKYLQ